MLFIFCFLNKTPRFLSTLKFSRNFNDKILLIYFKADFMKNDMEIITKGLNERVEKINRTINFRHESTKSRFKEYSL